VEYAEFLDSKRIVTRPSGVSVHSGGIHPMLFPFQRDIVRWALRLGKACIFADCGLGKGQPPESKVLTPAGWKEIGLLHTGDTVIASDGKGYNVSGVYHKSARDTYRIFFSDRKSFVVDDDHFTY